MFLVNYSTSCVEKNCREVQNNGDEAREKNIYTIGDLLEKLLLLNIKFWKGDSVII